MKFFPLLLILCCFSNCQVEKTSLEPIHLEGIIEMEDGAEIYFSRYGNGPQNVIIPAALYLEGDLKELAGPRRSLVFYDMRNRGQSGYVADTTHLTIYDDVKDLEAIRKHFGFDQFSVFGYSYLGLMIMLYALDHPDRLERAIQIGPVPLKYGTSYPERFNVRDTIPVIDSVAYEKLVALFREGYHEEHPEEFCERLWEVRKYSLVGNPGNAHKLANVCAMSNEWLVNFRRHLHHHFGSVQKLDLTWEEMEQIQMPVLTFHGTRDRNAPYGSGREWAYHLPNARLITVEGAAHSLWVEENILEPVNIFLDGEWPDRAENVQQDPLK